jgi:ABC-type lipoprotein export system ATPase subunit
MSDIKTKLSLNNLVNRWRGQSLPVVENGADTKNLIELWQVVKVYETPAGSFTAIKGIDLSVEAGDFVTIIGKSGSGKSTLINMITGIDRPTLGEIYVVGTPLHQLNESQIAPWRGRNIGVIFQFFQLLPTLSLVENIILPMEYVGLYGSLKERKERALHLLDLVGLAEQAHKLPAMVSGGQQQRAAIARALANDPALLVADEPTGSLDSKTADTIFQLFEDLVAQQKTILMVTHDRDLASRVGRVILLADGELADRPVKLALPDLDQKQMVDVSVQLTPTVHEPNTVIFNEGDTADQFYIITRGQVEIVKQHPSGHEIMVATLGPGQYFGEMGLLDNNERRATARTTADGKVVLMGLDRATFSQLMTDSQLTQDTIARLMRQRMTTTHLLNVLPQLGEETFGEIELSYEHLTYEPGQIIFHQGDVSNRFYLIIQGEVDVLESDDQSDVRDRLTSGQYFGEVGLLVPDDKQPRTVRAAPDSEINTELVAIEKETFRYLITQNKMVKEEIALAMRQHVSEKLQEFMPDFRRRSRKGDALSRI